MQTFMQFAQAVAWLALAVLFIRASRVAREKELQMKARKDGDSNKRTTQTEIDY